MAAMYDILEACLCDLTISLCNNSAMASEVAMPLKTLVFILQRGSKSVISGKLSKLLHKVIECLPLWPEDWILIKILRSFLLTLLYYSFSAQDESIAKLIGHSRVLENQLIASIAADEEWEVLSAVNIISALYACTTAFKFTLNSTYNIPVAKLSEAMNEENIVVRVVYLQLWYAHLKHALRGSGSSLLCWSTPDCNSYQFDEVYFQVMYFWIQQGLCSQIPIMKRTALKLVPILQEYMNEFFPVLGKSMASQAWNDLVIANESACGASEDEPIDQQISSPFITYQGITLILLTEIGQFGCCC